MGLALEIAGEVRDLVPAETEVVAAPPTPVRLRDSHHAVARLIAEGLNDTQVSYQTGYTLASLWRLRQDPAFQDLVAHYRINRDEARMAFEYRMLLMTEDLEQELRERLHEHPETFSPETLVDAFKVHADRAGFAPINRSITKTINYNIGDRLDAARRKRDPAAIEQQTQIPTQIPVRSRSDG